MSGRLVPAHVLIDEVTGEVISMHANGRPHAMAGGASVSVLAASTSLSLNQAGRRLHLPYTVTGATTINVSGATPGAEVDMVVIANGTHAPTVLGASAWLSNFGYVNTNGAHNLLSAWHDGAGLRYAWSQLETITAAPPAPTPPAPDTTAPTYGVAAIQNAAPNTIVIPVTEAVGLSTTLTGSATVTVGGVGRTVSGAAVVGSAVQLVLASPVVSTDAVLWSAPAGFVRDLAGNQASLVSAQSVTNNVLAVGGTEDAATIAYRAAAVADGTTLNEVHVGYLDTLFKSWRAAGVISKVTHFCPAINDALADTMLEAIGGGKATTIGSVAYDPALGWSTSGLTGVIRTPVQAVAGNWGMGAYLRTAQPTDSTTARGLMGTGSANDSFRIIGNRTPGGTAGTMGGHVSNLHGRLVGYAGVTTGGLTAGAWTSIRRSPTEIELFRNGVSVALNTGVATVDNAVSVGAGGPVVVMNINNDANGVPATTTSLSSGSRVSGYWFTDGTMTAANELAFYTALQAFQTSLGRQV